MSDDFHIPEDDSADEETQQAKLQKYYRALEQEFDLSSKYVDGKLEPEQVREKTIELICAGVPKAVSQIIWLAQHAKNETTRLKAATYIADKAIGKQADLVGDPLEAFIKSLTAENVS